MKLNSLLLISSTLLVALVFCGCSPLSPIAGEPITNLVAASLNETSVRLRWNAPGPSNPFNPTIYDVSWDADGTNLGGGHMSTTDTIVTITELKVGTTYRFTVQPNTGELIAPTTSINWAATQRSSSIRLYEAQSNHDNGLVIYPQNSGPKAIDVEVGGTGNLVDTKPDIGFIVDTDGNVVIGSTFAIPEFSSIAKGNSRSYISSQSWETTGLNDWFMSQSLDTYIPVGGNLLTFTFDPMFVSEDNTSQGFLSRIGVEGNYHYARVFITRSGDLAEILMGTAPDRYLQLEISYQTAPNIPFAKHGVESPVGQYSRKQ